MHINIQFRFLISVVLYNSQSKSLYRITNNENLSYNRVYRLLNKILTEAIYGRTIAGQPIFILREGSQRTKGREAQNNNIMAAKAVAAAVRTTLGPKVWIKCLLTRWEIS